MAPNIHSLSDSPGRTTKRSVAAFASSSPRPKRPTKKPRRFRSDSSSSSEAERHASNSEPDDDNDDNDEGAMAVSVGRIASLVGPGRAPAKRESKPVPLPPGLGEARSSTRAGCGQSGPSQQRGGKVRSFVDQGSVGELYLGAS